MAFTKNNGRIGHKNHDVYLFSMVTYLVFILGLIWFIMDEDIKRNTLARFHFKQAFILFIFHVIALFIALILVPIRKWLFIFFTIVFLVFAIIGVANAQTERKKELPYIGHFHRTFEF